jgi:2,3-bisphosphoglycerate-independent phosphoglycerate mutase
MTSSTRSRLDGRPRPPSLPMGKVLFIFLDGVGIGRADPDTNPFFQARLPTLRSLLGGELPHLDNPEGLGASAVAFPLDATLGVEGLPQSGTGQTALLTGKNAPGLYGRHFGPWVPVRLRPLLQEMSILARATSSGASCAFANAYPKEYATSKWARRPAAPPLAASAAGVMTREARALAAGDALSSEIVNTPWRTHLGYTHLPDITAETAGANLARISSKHRLTFFAHYATDLAGHRGKMRGGVEALERVDAFLAGVTENLSSDTLLVLASDHGNLEDITQGHTLNPVLGLLSGPKAVEKRTGLERITQISTLILDTLAED